MILENFIYLRMKFYNEFYKRMLNFITIQLDQNEKWNLYLVMEVNHEIPWYGLATISTLIVFPAKDKNFPSKLTRLLDFYLFQKKNDNATYIRARK